MRNKAGFFKRLSSSRWRYCRLVVGGGLLGHLLSFSLYAQADYSLVGLGNFGPQGNFLHPARSPQGGRGFVALPVLGQTSLHAGNAFTYRQLSEHRYFLGNLLDARGNAFSADLQVGLLYVGLRTSRGMFFSFFANERVQATLGYPRDFVEFATRGNYNLQHELTMSTPRAEASGFHEIGLGASLEVTPKLRLGMHLKYLIGWGNVATNKDATLRVEIDKEAFSHRFHLKGWQLRSTLLPLDSTIGAFTDHLAAEDFLFPNNPGFAIDLGMAWAIYPFLRLEVSVRDLGMIFWNRKSFLYDVPATAFEFEGLNLIGDRPNALLDSLQRHVELHRQTGRYRTILRYSGLVTASWAIDSVHTISTSIRMHRQPLTGVSFRMYYALSYLWKPNKRFSGAVSLFRYPGLFTIGAALAWRFGPVQLYASMGNLIGVFKPSRTKSLDVNIGFNLIFGKVPPRNNMQKPL